MTEHRRPTVLRVAVLDRHPAFRMGVDALLGRQAGLEPAGGAADPGQLWPMLRRVDPDVVLVDHHAGRIDRLVACLRIRAGFRARVILCPAGGEPELPLAAALAGADAVVDKAEPVATLTAAIRAVGGGAPALPDVSATVRATAAGRLSPLERALLAMRLARAPHREIAAVCGIPPQDLDARLATAIATLLEPPRPTARIALEVVA